MKKEDLQKSKSFCVMPWINLATDPTGTCRICCLNNEHIKDESGNTYNLGHDDIEEIYNSNSIKSVRHRMLAGEQIDACNHCWNEENNSGYSQRQVFNKLALDEYPQIVDMVSRGLENNYKVDYDPIFYDFRFGNLCNLKCRSCSPLNSSQIAKEYKKIHHNTKTSWSYVEPDLDNINEWYQTTKFKDNVYRNIREVKKIYFTGGEPTLVDENYRLMERLISEGIAKDVHLQFNTNMTNARDDFYSLIQKFKTVEIAISIEGYGEIQEYLRFPSNWESIENNIRRMADMPENIVMLATPVVQSVNLEYMVDFFKFIEDINRAKGWYRIRMLPILLEHPNLLSAHILPYKYKQECFSKIKQFVDNCDNFKTDHHFMGRYKNLEVICSQNEYDRDKIKSFKDFTLLLDKNRKQTLEYVNPNLWKIINNV